MVHRESLLGLRTANTTNSAPLQPCSSPHCVFQDVCVLVPEDAYAIILANPNLRMLYRRLQICLAIAVALGNYSPEDVFRIRTTLYNTSPANPHLKQQVIHQQLQAQVDLTDRLSSKDALGSFRKYCELYNGWWANAWRTQNVDVFDDLHKDMCRHLPRSSMADGTPSNSSNLHP